MFRTILCTLALTVALTAAAAHAGGFNVGGGGGFKYGGGGGHGHSSDLFYRKPKCHNNKCYTPIYRPQVQLPPPVVHTPCYYQVCYTHPNGTFQKHEIFPSLNEAQLFAAKVQHLGYEVSISKYAPPHYNAGIGQDWMP